jgi:hypothetical protein
MNLSLDTNNSLTMKGSTDVVIINNIEIMGTGTTLPVKVVADFSKIPQHLHGIYLQSLSYQYDKNVVVWNNTEKKQEIPRNKKSNLDKIINIIFNLKNLKK